MVLAEAAVAMPKEADVDGVTAVGEGPAGVAR